MGLALGATLLLSACGSTGTSTPTANSNCPSSSTVASWHLVTSGKLTIASDTTYPPAESLDSTGKAVGYDMDLAREFAKRLCLTANIQSANFDSIIGSLTTGALGQQRYDMSISSFTITSDRQQKVDMIPYFQAGESIIVPNGSSLHVTAISGLCGHSVAVETGTTEEGDIDTANAAGGACASNKIKKLAFQTQDSVIQQVIENNADAGYQDSPITDYYVKLNPGKIQDGGFTVAPSPEGLVMRKDNQPLETAIKNALAAMRADGTYKNILTQWGVASDAYPPLS